MFRTNAAPSIPWYPTVATDEPTGQTHLWCGFQLELREIYMTGQGEKHVEFNQRKTHKCFLLC